jgi:hypothetical protein
MLYSKKDCSLCDEMERDLQALLQVNEVKLRIVKIDNDPELQHRYGARLPVLVSANNEICEIKLDVRAVQTLLSG